MGKLSERRFRLAVITWLRSHPVYTRLDTSVWDAVGALEERAENGRGASLTIPRDAAGRLSGAWNVLYRAERLHRRRKGFAAWFDAALAIAGQIIDPVKRATLVLQIGFTECHRWEPSQRLEVLSGDAAVSSTLSAMVAGDRIARHSLADRLEELGAPLADVKHLHECDTHHPGCFVLDGLRGAM